MSQHSQTTQEGPGLGQLAAVGAATGLSALGTGFVTDGSDWGARQVVATILGVALTTVLLRRGVDLMAQRAVANERAARVARDMLQRELALQDRELALRERELALRERDLADREFGIQECESDPVDHQRWMGAGRPPPYDGISPEPDPVAEEVDQAVTRYLDEELDPDGYHPAQSENLQGWTYDPERRGWVNTGEGAQPAQEGPVVYPERSPEEVRRWLTTPVDAPRYAEMPLEYVPDPERPWNAFEPSSRQRAALGNVPVPLPPRMEPRYGDRQERDGYVDPGPYSSFRPPVSPGRHQEADTEVINRVQDSQTEVINRVG